HQLGEATAQPGIRDCRHCGMPSGLSNETFPRSARPTPGPVRGESVYVGHSGKHTSRRSTAARVADHALRCKVQGSSRLPSFGTRDAESKSHLAFYLAFARAATFRRHPSAVSTRSCTAVCSAGSFGACAIGFTAGFGAALGAGAGFFFLRKKIIE